MRFQWADGPFLTALREEKFICLDEINLASQPVLEALNAVLDHRGTLYIPELDRTFSLPPSVRIFATMNPVATTVGRKSLPKSFCRFSMSVQCRPRGCK